MTIPDWYGIDLADLQAVAREFNPNVSCGIGLRPALADVLLDHFLTAYASFYDPFPEVVPTLHWMRDQRLKIGIITNGGIAAQESKIHRLGLAPLMDTVLISEREGVRKPDAAIFERALVRLGVDAASAWFVGITTHTGAHEAGLTAVWRRAWGQTAHATHTITSLDELIPLLTAAGTAQVIPAPHLHPRK